MDEKESFGFENEEPAAEDTAAEVTEETAEAAAEDTAEAAPEEFADEVPEEPAEDDLESEDAWAAEPQPVVADEPKKGGAGKIVAIVIIVIAVIAAAGYGIMKYVNRNPYNAMGYVNISGRTIKEVSDTAGFNSVEEFLAQYGLPADMPEDTEEAAAYYNIPTSKIAEMYGMDLDALKQALGLGDDVTGDMTWGEAEGKAKLKDYVGEDNVESFKEEYGLGDDVTGETLWGEVRNTVDKKTLEKQKESEKANSNTGSAADDGAADSGDAGDTASDGAADGETTAE